MIRWPNGPLISDSSIKEEISNKLSGYTLNSYKELEFPINFGIEGIMYFYLFKKSYIGFWVPNTFTKLKELIFRTFFANFLPNYQGDENLVEILDSFHEYRDVNPQVFTSEVSGAIDFPPTWLLNHELIAKLLPYYNYDDIFSMNTIHELVDYLLAPLSEVMKNQILAIPQELKLSILKILEEWVNSINFAEGFEFLWQIGIMLSNDYKKEFEIFVIKYLDDEGILDYFSKREIDWLDAVRKESESGGVKKLANFIIGNYYFNEGEYKLSSQYYNYSNAILISQGEDTITTRAYIRLAKIYNLIGDFNKSAFYYAVALKFLGSINDTDLYLKSKQEYFNLKIAQIVNQLHTSIYLLNKESSEKRSYFSLLISIDEFLNLLVRNKHYLSEIVTMTKELMMISLNLLRYYKLKFDEYGIDTFRLMSLLESLIREEKVQSDTSEVLLQLNSTLNTSQPIQINRVIFLMKDGRLIAGYRSQGNKLVASSKERIDEDVLFSSSISAVSMFVTDALEFGSDEKKTLEGIDLGFEKMMIGNGEFLRVVVFVSTITDLLNSTVENFIRNTEDKWRSVLSHWIGSINDFTDLDTWITPFQNLIND